jgi:hypothetical protein
MNGGAVIYRGRVLLLSAVAISLYSLPPLAYPVHAQPPVKVCSLLPKSEVKKHLPWIAALDGMQPEETPIGTRSSSCNYPSVDIQVLFFKQETVDALKKLDGVEKLSGIGDEAYFRNNRGDYAEVFVKVGNRILTVQGNVNNNMPTVKAGAISLAKALVEKLR